ncbi:MAG: hypothetical protein CMC13_00205 [Flavobacteriaceae bacterium]|nr:hypothetical protein [Flavobacteriaceae bacterium]|tara:strand:- start:7553 stop:9709 length:2157 start_codon:yes stop_codon:yes gene_type:complete
MKKFGKNLQRTGANLTAGLSLPLAGLGALSIKTAADFETLNTSLVTALEGNEAAAKKAFDQINKFAATTPFQVDQVAEAFIKLKNLGLDPSERALTSYGNTAAAMGKSLNQVVEAVADAATGEFERLKEFGIKAKQQGDRVTFTFKGIETTVKKDAAAIQEYLLNIGEVDFAGGMERQSKTFNGRLSTLKDNLKLLAADFGAILIDAINPFIDKIGDVAKSFKNLSPETKKIIVVVSALAASIGPVLVSIGFLATNVIPGLISALAALKVAIASNPIGLLATVLAATAGAALVANSRFTALTNATKEYSDITAKAADNIADEKVQLDTLLRTARNEKLSKEERIKAINKLNEIVPQYNKELSLETVNTDKAKAATDKYVQSLLLKAKVQAAQEKLVEVERELLNLQLGTNAAAQPSLWQNLANGFTAAGNAGAFVSKTAKDVVANLSEEEKQLNLLQEKIVSFLSENKEVAAQFNEQTTAIQNTNKELEGYRAKVESVNSLEPEGAKKMAAAIGEIGVMARGVVAPLTAAQTKALEVGVALSSQVAPLVESAIESLAAGFGKLLAGFANGTAGLKDIANLALGTLGDLMIRLGEIAIKTAIGVEAIIAAFELNPTLAAVAGIALIAFGNLIKSSMANAPGEVALANGGVVFGETLSIIGDNRNAAFDPEVVSPLSKLKEFISPGDGGGSGKVELSGEFKINGKDLALALDRTNQRRIG